MCKGPGVGGTACSMEQGRGVWYRVRVSRQGQDCVGHCHIILFNNHRSTVRKVAGTPVC